MCTKTRFEEEAKGNSEMAYSDYVAFVSIYLRYARRLPKIKIGNNRIYKTQRIIKMAKNESSAFSRKISKSLQLGGGGAAAPLAPPPPQLVRLCFFDELTSSFEMRQKAIFLPDALWKIGKMKEETAA